MASLLDPVAQVAALSAIEQSHTNTASAATLPPAPALAHAESSLPRPSSPSYLAARPAADVARHISRDVLPALTGQAASGRYYGFVTGSALPLAQWADGLVGRVDQNVQVHLPAQTAATAVEDAALAMAGDLLGLGGDAFPGRTVTTGATASNILGLACGRETAVGAKGESVGELGILAACAAAGITRIQVLTSGGHSSLAKAASVVGLGRRSVVELGVSDDEPWRLDIDAVEKHLASPGTASIISVSAGEVNTGRYAVDGQGMTRLRALADRYGAWIHVDGAFGIFARILPDSDGEHDYTALKAQCHGLELADSITVDGHKVLNVPYDCGLFFTRSLATLQSVCTNGNAAYLLSAAGSSGPVIPSPLNVGLENSRRFRALPLYAVLLSEGREGLSRHVARMAALSRRVAAWIDASEHYDLLPGGGSHESQYQDVFIIVLFRARDDAVNDRLVEGINATRQMYVSGTSWRGRKAARIAVSSWKVDVQADLDVVTSILEGVATAPTE